MIFVSTCAFSQVDSMEVNVSKLSPNLTYSNMGQFSNHFLLTQVIPAKFYVKNLSFFCRQEIKFEAATGIPLKFRLGSVQYCDYVEGKKNAGILPAY